MLAHRRYWVVFCRSLRKAQQLPWLLKNDFANQIKQNKIYRLHFLFEQKIFFNWGRHLWNFLGVSDFWEVLCSEAQSEGLECTPYSFRHRYAYVSHTRPQDNGTMRSITQIAEAMGHDPETNFKSYARFKNKNLAKVFDRVEV